MTKAEAKEYLDNYRKMYADLAPERFLEALDIMLNESSLPSNLDDAANEEADELLAHMKIDGDMIYIPTAKALMIALARFGAEWMAGQGETFNGYISVKGKRSLIAIEGKSDIYKYGEKVVVQIRKK